LEAFAFDAGVFAVAGCQHGVQIRYGSTGRQDAVSAFVADDVAHLLHRDVLHENEDGRDLVGEHVCVGRGRQPLARHRYHVHAVAQLIEKTWMTCFHLVFERVPAVGQKLVDVLRFVGQRQVENLEELLRVVEVEDFGRAVESRLHILEQHLDELAEELIGESLTVFRVREQIRVVESADLS